MTHGGHPVLIGIPEPIPWERRQDPDSDAFVAVCQPFRLAAWGSTEDEMEDCKGKVMTLLLAYLSERGVMESFMAERGFSVEVVPIVPLPDRKHLTTKPKKARRKASSGRRRQQPAKADRRQVYVRSLTHAYV
ncbi:MAG: hypothetical protein OXK74_02250 [Gemmatimonadota bacterium]|nr:hypothetical protein [Gemmatimonadota bacterium]